MKMLNGLLGWGQKRVDGHRSTFWLHGLFKSRYSLHSPFAGFLLARIFTLYFSVALVVTLAQTYRQYADELDKLQAEQAAKVKLIEPGLAKSLWDIDESGTQAIIEGLSKTPSLSGVHLKGTQEITLGITPNKPVVQDVNPHWKALLPTKLYEQTFHVHYAQKPSSNPQLVGTLHLYASSNTVVERAMNVLVTIVASAIIKTGALWLILYFTISSMVARPLIKLASGLNRVNHEHHVEGEPPILKLPLPLGRSDEMKSLLRSFVLMRRALRRSQRKLLSYQSELEQKILDRTRELRDQAMHDALTGLLNRRAFGAHMSDLFCESVGADINHVLCMIDLDHFKLVNDTFGHTAGDQVLQQVAGLLRQHLRPDDTIARLGGDEFAVIMRNCSLSEAQDKMNMLATEVSAIETQRDEHRVSIGMSVGLVSFSAQKGHDLASVIESADVACYAAKEAGRYQVKVFREGAVGMRRKVDTNWVNVIQTALAQDQFLLYVQPIHAASNHEVHYVEVLVRLGLYGRVISPGEFLPAAQRYGLSTKIDEWVLEHTLRYLSANAEFVRRVGVVHVNLSTSAITNPGFYRFALRLLRRYPLPAGKLCFEVTESAVIQKLDDAVRIIKGLRKRGITFALDDFGHGASSYTYLQTLPVNQVKIDGSFVRTMVDNNVSLAIVKSMTEIAHMARMVVVAEYVEDEAIANKLRELDVDYLQGYWLSQPMPIDTLLATLPGEL